MLRFGFLRFAISRRGMCDDVRSRVSDTARHADADRTRVGRYRRVDEIGAMITLACWVTWLVVDNLMILFSRAVRQRTMTVLEEA